jgi:hypothetical protein
MDLTKLNQLDESMSLADQKTLLLTIQKIVREEINNAPNILRGYPAIVVAVNNNGLSIDVQRVGSTVTLHGFKNPYKFTLIVGQLVYLCALNCSSNNNSGNLTNAFILVKP